MVLWVLQYHPYSGEEGEVVGVFSTEANAVAAKVGLRKQDDLLVFDIVLDELPVARFKG